MRGRSHSQTLGRDARQTPAGPDPDQARRQSGLSHEPPGTLTLSGTRPRLRPLHEFEAPPSVFDGVSRFTHVCEYDRPGTIRYVDPPTLTDRSTPVFKPRSLRGMVDNLRTLLAEADIRGPHLLVAHSYGGLIVRLFAQLHPADTAGLVLVDAFGAKIKALFGADWTAYEKLLNRPGTALDSLPGFETADIDGAIRTVQRAPHLPPVPLAVLSKTEPFATAPGVPASLRATFERVWPLAQNTLVGLEPQTPHILATGSDHYVQIHDPDLTVNCSNVRASLILDRSITPPDHPGIGG